jgi:mono/diheme cytochrome c family protein
VHNHKVGSRIEKLTIAAGQGRTDATVRTIIQQGKGRMPAFGTLSESQIDDLVAAP